MLKEFRRPWLWLGLWLLAVAVVAAMSLGTPPPTPQVTHLDKVQHLGVYLVLAAGAVQVFRPGRALLGAAVVLVAVGGGLEVLQGALTENRMMDVRDALANTLGVLLGAGTARWRVRDLLLRVENPTAPGP